MADTSVILSTFNAPDWLEKTLWGYAAQTDRNFQVVIADDGSTRETAERIERVRRDTGLDLLHVWHEDRGFQKCRILNRSIQRASGDYLIFSDGDCIPRSDFVSTHRQWRQPNCFLSGGYFKLPMGLSVSIGIEDIRSGRAFALPWLRRHGLPRRPLKDLRLSARPEVARWLNRVTTTRASWNGHNASGWKADLLAVNGFDERMEYGGEDRELGERLVHHGVRPVQLRYSAVCLHLDHQRGYVTDQALARNRMIRQQTQRQRTRWTDHGIRPAA